MLPLFATGVNDTNGKFAAGVVDTGGNLPKKFELILLEYSGAGGNKFMKKTFFAVDVSIFLPLS